MDRLQQAKCSYSPTGVHHWMIESLGVEPWAYCKFCGTGRRFQGIFHFDMSDLRTQNAQAIKIIVEADE